MKKKYRNIVVNGKTYAWNIIPRYNGISVRIWEDKKIIYNEFILGRNTITPKFIAEKIKKHLTK